MSQEREIIFEFEVIYICVRYISYKFLWNYYRIESIDDGEKFNKQMKMKMKMNKN